ncbi:MAG: ABC transporter permease [Nitratireductor sp.]
MQNFIETFGKAFGLIFSFDPDLYEIIGLSLRVTFTAVFISTLIGFPLGALLAIGKFKGRNTLRVIITAFMGLPPVVVGLVVYMLLSANGPLGVLQLLYTPSAMIIAQVILVVPIIAALSSQVISDLNHEYDELLRSMGLSTFAKMKTLLFDARYSLVTAVLAGLGRAMAEVGAVIIVGGNINHVTRMMTTAITLETSKGELALALGLGTILIILSISINAALMAVQSFARRNAYA